jgi:formyl-CoA transferase
MPGIVPKLSATPGEIKWIGPEMGAHNKEVYQELLDVTPEEFEKLKADGIV